MGPAMVFARGDGGNTPSNADNGNWRQRLHASSTEESMIQYPGRNEPQSQPYPNDGNWRI